MSSLCWPVRRHGIYGCVIACCGCQCTVAAMSSPRRLVRWLGIYGCVTPFANRCLLRRQVPLTLCERLPPPSLRGGTTGAIQKCRFLSGLTSSNLRFASYLAMTRSGLQWNASLRSQIAVSYGGKCRLPYVNVSCRRHCEEGRRSNPVKPHPPNNICSQSCSAAAMSSPRWLVGWLGSMAASFFFALFSFLFGKHYLCKRKNKAIRLQMS